MVVTKIDAARRQLITAIRLFFEGGDPVSVYSLASNAWEVIDVLCTSAGVESFSKEARENLPDGHTLKYYVNEPCRNFFKHAEQDPNPDSWVEMPEANVAAILFLAAEDYIRFRQGGPVEAQVFQLWFIAVFPEKVTADDSVAQSKLEAAQLAFPGLANLGWPEKIEMGRQVLAVARKDGALAADPKTESSLT
ncbi:hypothetical protein L0Z42_08565 [Burkholderia multivorans]|uniref:hypothetical protein n=1 Tax=Burkholderia multivorans TaxID=87883 RepID=UPI0020195707|nr:hypothetical protein [Burkholderia multivorans]MCO1370614.1 hypothetical protein [Burkholderia multivorans]MCO1458125.1 hypothetical protein [Burkholderia multivorans]MCO1467121.1 hypothetical protein [Burkholderia multivorans]UQO18228.1 hypothetical protein L0Z02_06095 [Burkholderia multivorans]UQO83956.1 hypothetical protein L0Y86_20435 [Burkholderia multivorans]